LSGKRIFQVEFLMIVTISDRTVIIPSNEYAMSPFGFLLSSKFSSGGNSKDQRRATRKKGGSHAWIRLDGFALRPCTVLDLSDTGIQIRIDAAQTVPKTFTFLKSRDSHPGRLAHVKWRRGTRIGAEFVSMPDFQQQAA
jgi:hypothetical protein